MAGERVRLDARARELAPELVVALGDDAELVERDVALAAPPAERVGEHRFFCVASEAGDGAIRLEVMPGDRARAPSTFLLGLPDGSALVPELEEEAFCAIGLVHERSLGRLVQTFLDVQVAELEQRDVRVHRLPMMAPVDLLRVRDRAESWVGTIVSPSQTLLVGARAFCPRVDDSRFADAYRALADAHRERWRAFFGERGRDVTFVDVGALAETGLNLRALRAD